MSAPSGAGRGLSQFFFDGQYRRRPGLNTTTLHSSQRENVILQARLERKQRQIERQQVAAALTIQSSFQSYLTRIRVKNDCRSCFDEEMGKLKWKEQNSRAENILVDLDVLKIQLRRLCFFCTPQQDYERLIWFCQQLLVLAQNDRSRAENVMSAIEGVKGVNFCRLLVLCVECLQFLAPNTQIGFGPPLRTIEVYGFLEQKNFYYLMNCGYLESLRFILECRVLRSDIEMAPAPLAQSLIDSILLPVRVVNQSTDDPELRSYVLRKLIKAVLCPSASAQVVNFVLPALGSAFSKGQLSLEEIFDVANNCPPAATDCPHPTKKRGGGTLLSCFGKNWIDEKPEIVLTPFLVYSLLFLTEKSAIEEMNVVVKRKVLVGLSKVLPRLLILIPGLEPRVTDGSVPLGLKNFNHWPQNEESQNLYLLVKCAELLGSPRLVDGIFVPLARGEFGPENVRTLAVVCHVCSRLKHFGNSDWPLLYHLSLNGNFLHELWDMVLECTVPSFFGGSKLLIEQLERGIALTKEERNCLIPLLSLFCALFRNMLLAVHDDEFYQEIKPLYSLVPFTRAEMRYICVKIRNVGLGLIELAFPEARPELGENYKEAVSRMDVDYVTQERDCSEWSGLFEVVVRLLILLHERDARLQFCPSGFWSCHSRITINQKMFRSCRRGQAQMFRNLAELWTMENFEENEGTVLSAADMRNMTIMRQIPFVVPFNTRVRIFQELIAGDKTENGREGDGWGGFYQDAIYVRVRRTHIYQDALDRLSVEYEPNIKRPLRVQMTNWAGLDEAGIDGGGIFREFLTELLKSGFDPTRGLFRTTPHDGLLYPNPLALVAYPDDYQRHYYFLGRILGKLIYENQLAELRFASFFLVKLIGKSSENVDCNIDIHHLKSLDPVLYKNLLFLKTYDGDVRSLQLDFSVVVEELGEIKKIDLKPNGRNTIVDNSNKIEYLHSMADFYLNRQIRLQTRAFLNGLSELIDLDWLGMFDHREMQILISGVDVEIDVDDMRRHTLYSGYNEDSETVLWFWEIVEEFDSEQKRKLLKFITSCSRPPLLGFKDLYPPINIHMVAERDRLPTAATCMNLLKLPTYTDKNSLREKILYAVEAGEGFELS